MSQIKPFNLYTPNETKQDVLNINGLNFSYKMVNDFIPK